MPVQIGDTRMAALLLPPTLSATTIAALADLAEGLAEGASPGARLPIGETVETKRREAAIADVYIEKRRPGPARRHLRAAAVAAVLALEAIGEGALSPALSPDGGAR